MRSNKMYLRPTSMAISPFFRMLLNDDKSFRSATSQSTFTPRVNVHESADNFEIELAVPGFAKENIDIKLEKNKLSVKGKRELTNVKKSHIEEFSYREFSKSFSLNDEIDVNVISAKLTDGILTITLNKKEEKKPVKIDIEA